MRINMPREFYIPPNSVELVLANGVVAYLWFAGNGKPGATIFSGKRAKSNSNFYYRDYAALDNALALAVESQARVAAYKAERAEKRKAFAHNAKVGDIYRTSWGYEQTNVEYFEIIEIKGKHAILREIAAESVDTGYMTGRSAPMPGQFLKPRHEGDDRGQPIRRLIQDGYIKICDVRHAWPMTPAVIAGVKVYESSSWSSYH